MTTRWGIAATGSIAMRFAEGLALVDNAELVAVGSRSKPSADAFGEKLGIPRRHGSYEALAADHEVDVVYLASPQSHHREHTLLLLEAGKNVLCEKPFAMSEAQAVDMIATAKTNGCFLMEAMWTRFLPAYVRLEQELTAGRIGDVQLIESSFGFNIPATPEHRLWDPERGGGALLDLGIYPINLAHFVLGEPDDVKAMGHVGSFDVDEVVGALLGYDDGAFAMIHTAIRAHTSNQAWIAGSEGTITLPALMHAARALVIDTADGIEHIEADMDGNGLHYQAAHVGDCLADGLDESPVMPLTESQAMLRTLDRIKAQLA